VKIIAYDRFKSGVNRQTIQPLPAHEVGDGPEANVPCRGCLVGASRRDSSGLSQCKRKRIRNVAGDLHRSQGSDGR
jgi:hypothetical protein